MYWNAPHAGTLAIASDRCRYTSNTSFAVGGVFTGAGGLSGTQYAAAWSDSTWSSLGDPLPFQVRVLNSIDPDGAGPTPRRLLAGIQTSPALYSLEPGGWTIFQGGVDGTPLSMLVRPHVSGDELLIGGGFANAGGEGGTAARSVAKWTAAAGWSQVGDGLYTQCEDIGGATTSPAPTSLIMHDPDIAGPAAERLFAFGSWQTSGDKGMENAAAHDEATNTWKSAAPGKGGTSLLPGITAFDEDGAGPLPARLYASYYGVLGEAQGSDVARWTGSAWEKVGSCTSGVPGTLAAAHDGVAERLFMGGERVYALPPESPLKVYRDGAWENFPGPDGSPVFVHGIAGIDFDGAGALPRQLFAVRPSQAGEIDVIRWDGAAWTAIPGQFTLPAAGLHVQLTVADTGTGPTLYASGTFDAVGGSPANSIVRFNTATATWEPLGGGVPDSRLYAPPVAATINGVTKLYVGGTPFALTNTGLIASWDGTSWETVLAGGRLNGPVQAIAPFDDGAGSRLFTIGQFSTLDGGAVSPNILKWDGAAFASVGSGMQTGGTPTALAFNDGSGAALWITNQHSVAPASRNIAVLRRVSCCPADLGQQGGIAGGDGLLDNNDFVVFIDYFFSGNPLADMGIQGGLPGNDGVFDNNDFVVFIDHFFTGCR